MGDIFDGSFYELFGKDAEVVSQRLPLRRSDALGMVGFPVTRVAHWVPALVQCAWGLRVLYFLTVTYFSPLIRSGPGSR